MQQYLIYAIPVVVVLVIFAAGFTASRRAASKMAAGSGPDAGGQAAASAPKNSGIYEAPGVNQRSDHPLGAVQSVVRGRIRFIWFGMVVIGVALIGLYGLYFPGMSFDFERTPLNMTFAAVILAGAVAYGLRLIGYAFCRIKLRRTGFELCGVFGAKAYEYKDVDFYLTQTIEHKYASDGYRPMVMKTQNFNWIWVCQVLFRDGRKPILLKSSRYAWLKSKMQSAMDGLYKKA